MLVASIVLCVPHAKILFVYLVQLSIEGQYGLVIEVAGQDGFQLRDRPVGQNGGEIFARSHEPVVVLDGDGQKGIPLAHAHVNPLAPGKLFQVADGVCSHYAHHAVVAVVPILIVLAKLVLRRVRQNIGVVPNPLVVRRNVHGLRRPLPRLDAGGGLVPQLSNPYGGEDERKRQDDSDLVFLQEIHYN